MNKKGLLTILIISVLLLSCRSKSEIDFKQKSIEEIKQTEKEFEAMVVKKGIAEAFYFYADTNAVIQSGDTIIKGKNNIRQHYQNSKYNNITLTWAPDFVSVAGSCDMGYSYGKYRFSAKDATGKTITSKGYFHTVWKRHQDGQWKFVWD